MKLLKPNYVTNKTKMENLLSFCAANPKVEMKVFEAPLPQIPEVGDFPPLFLFPTICSIFEIRGNIDLVRISKALRDNHTAYVQSSEYLQDFSLAQVNGVLAYLTSREPFRLGKITLQDMRLCVTDCTNSLNEVWPPRDGPLSEKDEQILAFIVAQYTYAFLFFRTEREGKYGENILPCWRGELTPDEHQKDNFLPFAWPLQVNLSEQEEYHTAVEKLLEVSKKFAIK